ncbi:MAG: hypothetical protein DRQ51_10030 [Gammaproteobacteria bacterium]|nr:MAG: hypothetical protein DRQ51_10030 [Gammaproteobacteria bacterium]
MIKNKIFLAVFCLFFVSTTGAKDLKIIASTKIIHSISSQITQGASEPVLLYKTKTSPHHIITTPQHIKIIKNADLIIWTGENIEGSLNNILKKIKNKKTIQFAKIKDIKLLNHKAEKEIKNHHSHNHSTDHHLWLSIDNIIILSKKITTTLQNMDESNFKIYQQNYENLTIDLKTLKQNLKKNFASVRNNAFMVNHPSLNYLIADYNLNQVGIISPSELGLPSLKHINSLKKTIKEHQKICLLYEPGFPKNWVYKLKIHEGVKTQLIDPMALNMQITNKLYQNLMTNLSQKIISCLN